MRAATYMVAREAMILFIWCSADLSMMAKGDSGDTFDPEFSLNDAFFPFLDNGIT